MFKALGHCNITQVGYVVFFFPMQNVGAAYLQYKKGVDKWRSENKEHEGGH